MSSVCVLVQTDEDLRPINPPIIQEVDVLWNPFEDIEPRSTREDREQAAAAKRSASLPEPVSDVGCDLTSVG